jgi:phage gpG-like protein
VPVRARDTAALLHTLAQRIDGKPAVLSLLDQLLEAERERFDGGKGARWRKLAASTLRTDERQGRDPRPMIETGLLRDSLTRPGHPQQIVRVRPGQLTFGTRVYYARFHQRGQGTPKRAVVGLTRIQRTRLVEALRDFFFRSP